ncbi:TonB-dependent receptor [Sphingomonas sp.]|uniref:TonB-dependent receptor n=1 Tax=Sphingomonas sp. TaxID=28214 RepID=UPI003F726607
MMRFRRLISISASALAVMAAQAHAKTNEPAAEAQQAAGPEGGAPSDEAQEIVVTGFRQSLERAAEIKRTAPQIVDSIIAEDIGKFPDPTTAAALQRVPGVQAQVGSNNEIINVRIRGLNDILSTLDGREIFSTTGRGFALQDLPATALSRVDVIKTSTANLIEGGIAGITDLQLNKPFNFKKPTIVASVRGNYSSNVEKLNPQVAVLATDRWETGIGEIGALLNVSYAYFDYHRPITFVGERRSYSAAPFNLTGVMGPLNFGSVSDYGNYERPQANAAIQWQVTPELEIYANGLFAGYRSEFQTAFQAAPFFAGSGPYPAPSITNVVTNPDECITANVAANGANGTASQQRICNLVSATFNNVRLNSSTQSRRQKVNNYLGAFGFKYDNGPASVVFDAAYQKSTNDFEQFIIDVGKPITVNYVGNVSGGGVVVSPGNPAADASGYAFRNGLNQTFDKGVGELWQARVDGTYEFDGALGFLKQVQAGLRFADRSAVFQSALVAKAIPGGDFNTPVAGNLPAGFMVFRPGVERANNGAPGLTPDPDYLRSEEGRDVLRAIFGLPLGQPAYQADRRFDASERTYAGYVQLGYEIDLGGPVKLDGLIGVRPTRTERSIAGAGLVSGVPVPVSAKTTDTDVLPNASARLQLGGGLQARATYARAIRRPEFNSLNPGLTYTLSTNPNVINSGSAGNPYLRPQISDSYDASLEYYFGSSFVSVAAFYRDIKDRVISAAEQETIGGQVYNISRPRNIGAATLKGIEISGQTFFDFLPGALGGLGAFGNFTLIDSEVEGTDRLAGYPLLQVSKYNYNIGALYERGGLSGRIVYTYRSTYYDSDATGNASVRSIDSPILLAYVRPAGRLDFGFGYDVNSNIRVDVGGANILRSKYKSYYNFEFVNLDYRDDDSVYSIGLRARF